MSDAYVDRLVQDWDGGDRSLPRGVGHNANGAAGEVLTKLLKKLPGEHSVLNSAIDGRFPRRTTPDPTIAKNQEQLIAAVAEAHADLGIGFDGDADRVGCDRRQGRHAAGRPADGGGWRATCCGRIRARRSSPT